MIKIDMEMPKYCGECPCCMDVTNWEFTSCIELNCSLLYNEDAETLTDVTLHSIEGARQAGITTELTRHKDCPLIEVED